MRFQVNMVLRSLFIVFGFFGLRLNGFLQSYRALQRTQLSKKSLVPSLSATLGTSPTALNVTNVVSVELNDELKTSFLSYAMSTILGRALPDARDGLKPVHRRVLYAMQVLNLLPDSTYRKCARVVGEVLGKFHPHGDQSVYDALVRMAQDFVMLHPLVSGHGNFGSVDNDPPAAMRYTESKLSSLAFDALLHDIKEDTVDFVPNFDGNEMEPLVLPARLPMLLLNGASGIAVGMATNIPPHNLAEIADALVALIENPLLSDEKLFKIVKAPDFPTGGSIIGNKGVRSLFETGHGSIVMRAKTNVEIISTGKKSSRNAIIVTELPYMTNKAALLERIADLVNDKKLDGIADLRDETDRDGMRVVIELKRDAVPAVVQNNLFKKTSLQTSFSGNMLALVDEGKQPRRLSLRDALKIFIDFRFKTIRRRTHFQLQKVQSREHVVQGMIKALASIEEIIELIKRSKDTSSAREGLQAKPYLFSTEQAEAILSLTLRRLTALEESRLKAEQLELQLKIAEFTKIMTDDKEVFRIMTEETKTLKQKHGSPRKTELLTAEAELSDQDLLANDRSVIVITESGYIKRMPIEEFEAQSRGGKGKAGARLSTKQDTVAHFFSCNDHDSVLFVTDRGIAYSVKAFQIPIGSRIAKGVPLPQVLPIGASETVTSVIPVDSFAGKDQSLVLLTSDGFVKKTPLKAFESITARGLTIISLKKDDSLRWARRCNPQEEILFVTKDGFASRFTAADLTSTGRMSRGVRALNLRDGDSMADMDTLRSSTASHDGVPKVADSEKTYVLVVTKRGYGKLIDIDEFRTQRRGGKGVIIIKFKSSTQTKTTTTKKKTGTNVAETVGKRDSVTSARICKPGDEVVFSTEKGTVIRQRVADISVQSRTATGVRLQKLDDDDSISMVDVVPPETSSIDGLAET